MFSDAESNKALNLAAVNSINWARILAQTTYYFHAYFSLLRTSPAPSTLQNLRFVVPTGNFGDILAGYFAKRMGLPMAKLVVATNENDILDRFWKTGSYTKKPLPSSQASNGVAAQAKPDLATAHEDGVKETLAPAMDILVSSNFERLLWFLAHEYAAGAKMDDEWTKRQAGQEVEAWLKNLKNKGGFSVHKEILGHAQRDFESERVSDEQTLETIKEFYTSGEYVLDPHSAIGVAAALRSMARAGPTESQHIALATAHPAKFAGAVDLALKDEKSFSFDAILPEAFIGLDKKERRVIDVPRSAIWEGIRKIVQDEVNKELEAANRN